MKHLKLIALQIVAIFAAVGHYAAERFRVAISNHMAKTGLVAYINAPFAANQFPSVNDLDRYMAQNPGALQVTRQQLYDTVNYPAAGATQLSLFTQPLGQGQSQHPGAAAGVTKQLYDTNMNVAGVLPRFQSFLIESIELIFLPGSVSTAGLFANVNPAKFIAVAAVTQMQDVNDMYAFYNSGSFSLDVSSGNLLTAAPLRVFPPKTQFDVAGGVSTNSATTSEVTVAVGKMTGRPYYLQPLITLAENAAFQVTLRWPNAIATPSTFNGSVKVVLDGYQIRATI